MDNISKIVLDKSAGKCVGYVLDVALDFSSMKKVGYYVVDEESESEFFVRSEDVLMCNREYIVIADSSVLQFTAQRTSSLLGKKVLDENCNNYGCVLRLEFQKEKMTKIITDKCEVLAKFVSDVGEDVVFIQMKKKKKALQRAFPRTLSDEVVSIQTAQTNTVTSPEKINLSANFYIGKICCEDIFGYNNEKIVLKNEVITKAVVEKAKRHNKLNQLFFAIKR